MMTRQVWDCDDPAYLAALDAAGVLDEAEAIWDAQCLVAFDAPDDGGVILARVENWPGLHGAGATTDEAFADICDAFHSVVYAAVDVAERRDVTVASVLDEWRGTAPRG